MKLIIFGATGSVGKQLVNQALLMGHEVKAYGRNVFAESMPEHKNLELVAGALFDDGQLLKAIKGTDAVLSALGGAFDGNDKTRSLGMKHIIAQMEKAGVQRIVAVGGKGLLNLPDGTLLMDDPDFPPQFLPISVEHLKAWQYLEASSLNYTIIGAPDLIKAAVTGAFVTQALTAPTPDFNHINIGDLALFMLNEVERNEYPRQRVGISNLS